MLHMLHTPGLGHPEAAIAPSKATAVGYICGFRVDWKPNLTYATYRTRAVDSPTLPRTQCIKVLAHALHSEKDQLSLTLPKAFPNA